MLDFIKIKEEVNGRGVITIYPEFLVKRSRDLMIRAGSFYAIWDEEIGLWSTSEQDVQRMVDKMVYDHAEQINYPGTKKLKLLSDFSSRKWTEWKQYCKSMSDNYKDLDEKIIFSNTEVTKKDCMSRRLEYALEPGETPAYDELMGVLYSPEERQKLEWSLGAVISGDSKKIQKFVVIYGEPGTGKSTFLDIIQELFPGYYSLFNAKDMTSSNNAFSLESLKDNPLIAIQHDGDLSKIEDNTLLNSVVSHESMPVNEKFKNIYTMKFKSFLFMGTNKPVRITDAKSGIIRRLIDVRPTGETVPVRRYNRLRNDIKFELGGIANHCLEVYQDLGKNYYNSYIPMSMISRTNDFYIFIDDEYDFFAIEHKDGVTLDAAWEHYKRYCDKASVLYPYTKKIFRYELKNYFESFDEQSVNGKNWYSGFRTDIFNTKVVGNDEDSWIEFKESTSIFDEQFKDCSAQYSTSEGIPKTKWEKTKTLLQDLNTKKEHYVRLPENYICIDFDLKDSKGEKSLKKNIDAASTWPKTYAELSKSGKGIHLIYIYNGDVSKLDNIYDTDIEIKKFVGNSALRRKLTKCNDVKIATISSGLPKKEKKVITKEFVKSERDIRRLLVKNLKKEIHPNTKPSIDFIYEILEQAYQSGIVYDVRDMAPDIQVFANNSTNNALYCLGVVSKMKFASSTEPTEDKKFKDGPMVFYDIEVYPNLFVVCYKPEGEGKDVVKLINPTPQEVEPLLRMKLVGFNNRRYDNHILYARVMGYTNEQLYFLSQNIINEGVLKFGFNEAYNISYTDVYDFLSASNKMSLKKWEIKLHINHMEMGIPWDKPVDESMYNAVAEYCANDVLATEAVFFSKDGQSDWTAREILADIAGCTVNDTTNTCTTRFIIGKDRNPQANYIYTDLSKTFKGYEFKKFGIDKSRYKGKIVSGKSIYKGEDPGEGGYVYSNPGIHYDVALLDIASMHPSSIIAMNMFGDEYTKRFAEIVQCRLYIKHKEYDKAKKLFDGKLDKYLDDEKMAKSLANALKTAINSVYGLTSARFPNKLKDERNIDNIVAKRGALFMIDLKNLVEEKGYKVVHIKTDSIKIANADNYIIDFVTEYGKKFGYNFEHEATYEKMCLINEAVYVAYDPKEGWTATGEMFKVPYVFKTMFSHEPIEFYDLCEVKSVTSALYLDYNEGLPEGEHNYTFIGRVESFVPVKEGSGGGVLLRDAGEGKFNAAEGTKKGKNEVWRWLQSEVVKDGHLEDRIDMSYYDVLVDKAIAEIEKFGDYYIFASNEEPLPFAIEDKDGEIPFEEYMNKPAA